MALGVNLHDVVRGAITALHPDEPCLWYRSTGQTNVKGRLAPSYAAPVKLMCQIQSNSDDRLYVKDREAEDAVTRNFYLYVSREARVAGIVRPDARGGDMLYRQMDGTWWLVTAVPEDFSGVSWEKVRCTLQIVPPDAIMPYGGEVPA